MCASMFPWRRATFCGCSKRTASLGAAGWNKFIGKFQPTIARPWTQMAAGNVRGGLAALDRLELDQGRPVELSGKGRGGLICGLRITGRNLDRCLAVSFTWEENHRFTDSIRSGLKERGVLPAEGTRLTVHESLRWTNQQKKDWRRYEPGQVVTFAPSANRPGRLRKSRAR